MKTKRLVGYAVALCAAGCAGTQSTDENAQLKTPMVAKASDDTWVSFTGTVTKTEDDGDFVVDYGPGTIKVQMEDWEWYPQASYLLVNDEVVVYGQIDADFFETRTVDGKSIYVADLDTQFFTSGVDRSTFPVFTALEDKPNIELRGTVKYISGDRFMLETASSGAVEVSTVALPYDPMDDAGYQKLTLGDEVRVVGKLTQGFFDDRELMAMAIISEQWP